MTNVYQGNILHYTNLRRTRRPFSPQGIGASSSTGPGLDLVVHTARVGSGAVSLSSIAGFRADGPRGPRPVRTGLSVTPNALLLHLTRARVRTRACLDATTARSAARRVLGPFGPTARVHVTGGLYGIHFVRTDMVARSSLKIHMKIN